MSRKKRKIAYRRRYYGEEDELPPVLSPETKKGIAIVILFVMAFLAIFSIFNLAGAVGLYIKQGLNLALGWGAYLFPVILIILAYFLLRPEKYQVKPSNYLGLIIFIFSYLGVLQLIKGFDQPLGLAGSGGGYLGYLVSYQLYKTMGVWATALVLLALLIISLLITFNAGLSSLITKLNLLSRAKKKMQQADAAYEDGTEEEIDEAKEELATQATAEDGWIKTKMDEENGLKENEDNKPAWLPKKRLEKLTAQKSIGKIPEGLKVTFSQVQTKKIQVPLSLLDNKSSKPTSGDIKANMEIIKATFENFGIEVAMDEVNVGPTVTQFTIKPVDGVRLSNILSLQNDLALALAAHPIRIEAPIPGKSLVGIEVPNQSIATVRIKEVFDDINFIKKKGALKAAIGKDVSGKIWSTDLANLPHILIAGATGSGKSVCINSIIISLLYQKTPEDLRFIMIDPKRVELTSYNNIPHLLAPVITDASKTINALRWTVREMDERYKLLEATGKRNIAAYNGSVITNRLPYIVVVIDELADLMTIAPKEIEAAIVRLAQMARAIGIHLVVATQRPSVNIITGLIKANITTRIAFAVASSIDSRTILDFSGAEKLLGKGDMLYISAELSKPKRIQGALVTDEEIERVTDFWRGQAEPNFKEEVTEKQTHVNLPGAVSFAEDGDELLEEAKDTIIRSGKASASFLQRRLRVGYARAARILDLLEEEGIIGPADGAKPREILVDAQNYSATAYPEEAEELSDDEESTGTLGPAKDQNDASDYQDENEVADTEKNNQTTAMKKKDEEQKNNIKINYQDNDF